MDKIDIMATAARHTYDGGPAEIALAIDKALEKAGFAVVPVEPTEAMLEASWRLTGESYAMQGRTFAHYKRHYAAMLKAAQDEA